MTNSLIKKLDPSSSLSKFCEQNVRYEAIVQSEKMAYKFRNSLND